MTLDQAYYHNKALERQDERERDCGMAGACEYYWNCSVCNECPLDELDREPEDE
jgi:hypothetical protein